MLIDGSRADIISTEHPNLSQFTDAIDILNALNASPTFTSGEPSQLFVSFLDRIERAVPSPEDGEDDTNESWGHSQFTAGKLTLTSVIESWASVGSPAYARRLIAAAVTTCRVARWLCKSQMSTLPAFYVSDNYLNDTCSLLWTCWKSASGVSVFI